MRCEREGCTQPPANKIHTRFKTYYTCEEHCVPIAEILHENRVWIDEIEDIQD